MVVDQWNAIKRVGFRKSARMVARQASAAMKANMLPPCVGDRIHLGGVGCAPFRKVCVLADGYNGHVDKMTVLVGGDIDQDGLTAYLDAQLGADAWTLG